MHDAMLMLFTGISPPRLQGSCVITGTRQRKLDMTSDSQEVSTGNIWQELISWFFIFFFNLKKKGYAVRCLFRSATMISW